VPSSFRDDRGYIEDLVVSPIDSVTRIITRAGAVRGNHVHRETVQWTYVVSGRLLIAIRLQDGSIRERELGPGEMAREEAGAPHAWKAIADCTCLVFTRGPRSGAGYESDTTRLAEEDWLL
jgi:quercetin dioxygenase-like cupin family protein